MTTDTSERGLETLIINQMSGRTSDGEGTVIPEPEATPYTHPRWQEGNPGNYGREYCVDPHELTLFLEATQPRIAEEVDIRNDGPTRRKFLQRLYQEIGKRGVIEVIRKGLRHGPLDIDLFYGTPSVGNPEAKERYLQNRFTVTRQLRYSREETKRALDLGIFINGLPIATFELKNKLTKQTVEDAVEQYKRDRDPREPLFAFGRCVVHFAVDDSEVRMCTELKGPASWFLPFNKGVNNGAGNPVNPDGIKTDYLWKEVLTPQGLTNILENYAQIVTETNPKTGKKKSKQIFPRYHQLDVVRSLLKDVLVDDVGKKYLIQHSAGSGKSNSIAWLAHQLVGVRREGKEIFDSVIVITDRRILDQQIKETIKGFAQVGSTIGHAERSGDLRKFLESGKKIIITTVQKFPFILNEIGTENQDKTFALIIDEAHSSQGGKTTAAMSAALAGNAEKDPEDTINEVLEKRMKSRKMVTNASYFAFTATPKAKTLEMFGIPFSKPDGGIAHRPYHTYSMKQAIQEGFIMDVLKSYTPIESYYTLLNKTSADPELDARRARKKLKKYVESHDHAIRLKAEIMVDHFHEQVITFHKLGGMARAMVICDNIERTIQYFLAIRSYLEERKSPYKAIVAFTGEPEFKGDKVSESILNGFPPSEITDKIQEDPYRFLICADKFQTGYDEPLLHTMYVDKHLSGVQAVQTLSRLNRAHPKKRDVFILDFKNNYDSIVDAFSAYYQTTILSEETDPNKLHDLKGDLDRASIYTDEQIDRFVQLYLTDAGRETLDPILDDSVEIYLAELDEDGQVDFKSKAKSFCRTYDFLSSILPYTNADWEKLSIFLNFLVTKLPAPMEEDTTRGLMEMIDMESYRTEKKATQVITLAGEDAWIDPVPVSGGAHVVQPEIDRLSNILKAFNERFGGLFDDADRVFQRISEDIAPRVAADQAFKNARENTPGTAQIEMTQALGRVMLTLLKDDTEVYKQFVENESFRRFVTEMVGELVRA